MSTVEQLREMRDGAIAASESAHGRIRQEQAIYNNDGHYTANTTAGRVFSSAGESLNPKATEAINKIKPAHEEAMPRIEVQADRSTTFSDDVIFAQDLQNWLDMMEEIDSEGEWMRSNLLRVRPWKLSVNECGRPSSFRRSRSALNACLMLSWIMPSLWPLILSNGISSIAKRIGNWLYLACKSKHAAICFDMGARSIQ